MIGKHTNGSIRKQNFCSLLLCIILLHGCKENKQNSTNETLKPKVVSVEGKVVSKDSLQAPVVTFIDERKLKKSIAGKPTLVALNNNVHIAGIPVKVKAGKPIINKMGTDTFRQAVRTKAVFEQVKCRMPKPVKAGLPVIKDNASLNIQYLDVEQGLNSSYISCLFEDRTPLQNGIWFGSDGGGVCRFDGENFIHFNKESGLNSNTVTCIEQDKKGALWFGTFAGGINKFNGNYFTIFSQVNDLGDNSILCILLDKDDYIWFGRDGGGLSKYSASKDAGGDDHFTEYTVKNGLGSNIIKCIFQDNKGNIWLGGDQGVCRFDPSTGTFFLYGSKQGLHTKDITGISQDSLGVLWFATDAGLISFDGIYFCTYSEKQGLSAKGANKVLFDKEGKLWIATDAGGIDKFDGKSFTHYTEKQGLSNNNVNALIQLQNDDLWAGTFGGGINKLNISAGGFTHYKESSGLSHSMVSGMIEDRDGNYWFATLSNGINKFDTSAKTFSQYTLKQGLAKNELRNVIQDRKGNIWIGTDGEGAVRFDPISRQFTNFTADKGLGDNTVWSTYEDKQGNIWFGTFAGVCKYDGNSITRYDESSGMSNNTVMCILQDRNNNLWFGTFGGGLTKFEAASNTFTHFDMSSALGSNSVICIVEDVNGQLWMGSDGGGVYKYDPETATFTNYTTADGLSSNMVWSILEDTTHVTGAGRFWIGTEKGLTYFSEKGSNTKTSANSDNNDHTYIVFTKKEGLLANDFILNAAMIDHRGYAWWGTGKGLTSFDIKNYKVPEVAPVLQLNDISINETYIDYRSLNGSLGKQQLPAHFQDIEFSEVAAFNNYPEKLHLPYDLNHLTFTFSAFDASGTGNVKYQYKIEGLDDQWSELTSVNKADYRNIPYGKFIFKVRAIGVSGVWSNTFSYPFKIHPPWWKSNTAKIIYVLLAILFVFGIVQWNSRRLRQRANELEEEIDKATLVIKSEKKKSDDLLLNILPEEVAEELKQTGETTAKQFNDVTVLFTDFVGFTTISEQMSATDLVAEIHKNFTAFDAIIEKYGLEKIKTIGDAYMAVCGLPHTTADHAKRVVSAALEIRDYINTSSGKFQIRIGVNSGSVVAGIVGVKKYAYDIWGDTVNTASRVESAGAAGKVNISGTTYEIIKDDFKCEYRGKIQVKGKGEVDMYFVE